MKKIWLYVFYFLVISVAFVSAAAITSDLVFFKAEEFYGK